MYRVPGHFHCDFSVLSFVYCYLWQPLCQFSICTRVLDGGGGQIIWKYILLRAGMKCIIYSSWKYDLCQNISFQPANFVIFPSNSCFVFRGPVVECIMNLWINLTLGAEDLLKVRENWGDQLTHAYFWQW